MQSKMKIKKAYQVGGEFEEIPFFFSEKDDEKRGENKQEWPLN